MEMQKKCDPDHKKSSIKKPASSSSLNREPVTFSHENPNSSRSQRSTRRVQPIDSTPISASDSREERKANGRIIAVCVALFLIFIGLYHAWLRRTAVVAGVIVPVLIMLLYTAWVLYSAKRHKRKMMMLRNAASLNSVNGIDKENVSIPLDEVARTKENLQNTSHINSAKINSTKYVKLNEISASTSRSHSKDINIRKHEHEKVRISGQHSSKPLAKVLPRQQSSITPTSLKEIPPHRRLSLDPHAAHIILKNDFDKERHGSLSRVENSKHSNRARSSKEKVVIAVR